MRLEQIKRTISYTLLPILLFSQTPSIAQEEEQLIPPVQYRIADTKYETNDYIVAAYYITDFGVDNSGNQDCTEAFQTALDEIEKLGGGTLFVPEGKYRINGTLTIPTGVIIAGDWISPDETNGQTKGAVLMAYSGKNDAESKAFITMSPNSQLRDISIWYPEQDYNNITPYPPTVLMYNSSVWGAEAAEVKNITFVNSYKAVQQGPAMNGCPNVTNIYGSPLSTGIDMDGITDVGRFTNIHFSPDYWAKSALDGAPDINGPHKDFIYNNATAVSLGRIDWSYFTSAYIEGYNKGILFRYSTCDDSYSNGELTSYVYPNGQSYDINIKNCETGLYSMGCSGAGEIIYSLNISDCKTGIYTAYSPNASTGTMHIAQSSVTGTDYALKNEGEGKLFINNSELCGNIYANRGYLNISASQISDCVSVQLDKGMQQASFSGNIGMPEIINTAGCVISDEDTSNTTPKIDKPQNLCEQAKKPAKKQLFVVTDEEYNAPFISTDLNKQENPATEDASSQIQKAIDDASEAGGGIVFCPPGRYRIKNQLIVPENVELRGAIDKSRIPIKTGTIFDVGNAPERLIESNFSTIARCDADGVENVLDKNDIFTEISTHSQEKNITVNDDYLQFYSAANADQAYVFNHSMLLASGNDDSNYTIKTSVKISQIKTGGQFFLAVFNTDSDTNRNGDCRLVTFGDDGKAAFGTNKFDYETDKWYDMEWSFNLSDISNKTVSLAVTNEDGTVWESSYTLPDSFQNNANSIGHLLINASKSSADEQTGASEACIKDIEVTKQPDNKIPVILNGKSGIRGIVFNQPNQSYNAPVNHPYIIQGRGNDIYAINVSLRNVYDGLDFFTYKCDNHYIDGLAGIALHNELRIGGNSENGVVLNSQFNWGCLYYGSESKYGSWEDSPVKSSENQQQLRQYLSENLDCIVVGDCQNELLFNNFSIFGSKGLYFRNDGNGGASGICIGHGVDGSRFGIYIDALKKDMDFINTQLVSFEYDNSAHITSSSNMNQTARFSNISCWSTPSANIIADGGNLQFTGLTFNAVSKNVFAAANGGSVSYNSGFVRNSSPLSNDNFKNISFSNMLFDNLVFDGSIYKSFTNCKNLLGRFSDTVPKHSENTVILFSEGFTQFPSILSNGIENVAASTKTFSEIISASENSNVTVVSENENGFLRLYVKSPSTQAHIYNHSLSLSSGGKNSVYHLELSFKINSLDSTGVFDIAMRNMTSEDKGDSAILVRFYGDKTLSLINSKERAIFDIGAEYTLCIDLDLRDITAKTASASLYDTDMKCVASFNTAMLPSTFQNNDNPIGHILIKTNAQDTASQISDILIDKIVVTQSKTEPEPTPASSPTVPPSPSASPTTSPSPVPTDLPTPTTTPTDKPDEIKILPSLNISNGRISGKIDASVSIKESADVILAIYDKYNTLVYIDVQSIQENGLSDITFDNISLAADYDSGYSIKCFVWDSIYTMKPQSSPQVKEL